MSTVVTHSGGTITPQLVDGYQAVRPVRTIVHPILNRTEPQVTFRPAGLRSGEFRMLFPEQSDAIAAYDVLSVPQVLALSDPDVPAVSMTFVVAGESGNGDLVIELDDDTRSVWWIVVPFQEVTV